MAYDGSSYAGWQVQPNAVTVQGVLQTSISKLCKTPIKLIGCGRTDTGVHALKYFAHFDTECDLAPSFVEKLNANLPGDISVQHLATTDPEWHARYTAVNRRYFYHISQRKDPYNHNWSFIYPSYHSIDHVLLQRAAEILKEYNSFASFCKRHSDAKHFLCQIQEAKWICKDEQLIFSITSNRFLRGMVRLIVGMCLNVSIGKINISDVIQSLDKQRQAPMPWSVPAHGLFLADVKYPDASIQAEAIVGS